MVETTEFQQTDMGSSS